MTNKTLKEIVIEYANKFGGGLPLSPEELLNAVVLWVQDYVAGSGGGGGVVTYKPKMYMHTIKFKPADSSNNTGYSVIVYSTINPNITTLDELFDFFRTANNIYLYFSINVVDLTSVLCAFYNNGKLYYINPNYSISSTLPFEPSVESIMSHTIEEV